MSPSKSSQQSDEFPYILKVLQRIDSKFDIHEKRVKRLEDAAHAQGVGIERRDGEKLNYNVRRDVSKWPEQAQWSWDGARPSRKGSPANDASPQQSKMPLKIPYSQWSIDRMNRFSKLSLTKTLVERLGGCWGIPDDNRLPLTFFKTNISKTDEKDLNFLGQFDNDLRAHLGNDFLVVDFDAADNTRLYRLGSEAIGSELEVEAQGSRNAPWSRLM